MNFYVEINFNSPTLSLGDNDCALLLWLFVAVDSLIGDYDPRTICGIWDVESTTRLDILFVVIILVDAYEWCWLECMASFDGSVDEYVPLVIVDDGPLVLVVIEPGDDDVAVVNKVGIIG